MLALCLGVPLALAVSRTNMPGRGFTHLSVLAAFVMPNFLGAIAWILLAGPNAGWLNRLWLEIFGGDKGPFNVFSFWGLAFVIALYTYPLIYVFTKSALDLVSTELEDAAAIHGAGKFQTMARVTLPLVLPSIIGAGILIFLEAIALYGTPALIAIPAAHQPGDHAAGVVLPVPAAGGAGGGVLDADPAADRGDADAAAPAAGAARLRVGVGQGRRAPALRHRRVEVGAAGLFGAGGRAHRGDAADHPGAGLAVQGLGARAGGRQPDAGELPRDLLRAADGALGAGQHGAVFGGRPALVCVVMGVCIAYATQRRITPFPAFVQFLALAPVAVPGLILAIGLYSAYAGPPFSLYGMGVLIVIAFTTRFLPIAVVASAAGVRALNPELEEAVRILGGGRITVLARVVVPLLKKTLVGAFILVFVICTKELSTAVFLTGPASRVVSVLTWT